MGGPSAEHEVSLATGENVVKHLDKEKYEVVPIKITKKGQWFVDGKLYDQQKALKECAVVFNALHGTFGEDGIVQALMDYNKVTYTGSGIIASSLAMDKLRSREIFKLAGFNVPKTLKIKKGENYQARLSFFLNKITKLPVVVKPCSNGSSVGVCIANDMESLNNAILEAFKIDKKVLVEEYIKGKEVTCGVLEGSQCEIALPVTEIIPKDHVFFDYKAKYTAGHTDEITPAEIDEDIRTKVQDIAVKAHQILGCKGYSRTDMILKQGNGTVYILETNTLPGLTDNSLLPKAASVAGLTFSQLLDKIIESAQA